MREERGPSDQGADAIDADLMRAKLSGETFGCLRMSAVFHQSFPKKRRR